MVANRGDYGGNIEVLPPTGGHPLGRMIVGDIVSSNLLTFFNDQEVQAPVTTPPTAWLAVGHVDEMFAFTGAGTQVLFASPTRAFTLMNNIPAAQRGGAVYFALGTPAPQTGTVTSAAGPADRINTGIDHTTGPAWEYVRIYADGGSGAAGQVAHISGRFNGYLEVDQVWDTTSKLVDPAGGVFGDSCLTDFLWNRRAPTMTATFGTPPAAGDSFVMVMDTKMWHEGSGIAFPAIITVHEVLADGDFDTLNRTLAQGRIDVAKGALQAVGGTAFVDVPDLYLGFIDNFNLGRRSFAFAPGLANVQKANGTLYFPESFAFLDNGQDAFETDVSANFPGSVYLDDWLYYHINFGEVHCGTNVVRDFPGLDWWDNQP